MQSECHAPLLVSVHRSFHRCWWGTTFLTGSGVTDLPPPDGEIIFQVSTIDDLLESIYDGVMPVSGLTRYGDIGIGTFASLDSELVMPLTGRSGHIPALSMPWLISIWPPIRTSAEQLSASVFLRMLPG